MTRLPKSSPRRWRALSCAAALLLTATTTGCVGALIATRPKGPSGEELDQLQRETAPYLAKGSASISGVVTLEVGSQRMVAPGNLQVYLTPATTYASSRLQEYVIEKDTLPETRESQLVLLTRTDANGQFQFQGLAAGDYLLACDVPWLPAGSSAGRMDVAYARVHVGAGETATANVTRQIAQK